MTKKRHIQDPLEITPKKVKSEKNIISPKLTSALDRTGVSDRQAMHIIVPLAEAVGLEANSVYLSRQTLRRERIKNRKQESKRIQDDIFAKFEEGVDEPWTVHWDGKMLEDIAGIECVDRLPILLTGFETEQLLNVPKLASGTGENTSNAVFSALKDWKLVEKVNCMCFDTTSSNTGTQNGACVLLEEKMQKKLLYTACRHHISELLLGAAFQAHMPPSSGPEIKLFKRFKLHWGFINHESISSHLELENSAEIISFCEEKLMENHPRDDYKELLELTIMCLGGEPQPRKGKGKHFMQPGAMHQARWMAKAIYTLKMFLFRDQFKMTRQEENAVREVSLFIVKHYVTYWFQVSSAISAPRLDLELVKTLNRDDSKASKAALSKLLNHLWYLNNELIALSFFDSNVPSETKSKMVENLKTPRHERQFRAKLLEKNIDTCDLSDCVTVDTYFLFETFQFTSDILKLPVDSWDENDKFIQMKIKLKHLKVVNDTAERGVALMSKFNKLITNDEEQKQYLLKVISAHRQKYTKTVKKSQLFD